MRAIKIQAHVEKDHTLSLKLPDDVREGPAEVIVLVPDKASKPVHSLDDFLDRLASRPRHALSKDEIDRHLEGERQSWD